MDLPCVNPATRRLRLLELLLTVTTLFHPLLAQQPQNALFNGKNLDGWKHVGPGSMVVENGMSKTEDRRRDGSALVHSARKLAMPLCVSCSSLRERNRTRESLSGFPKDPPNRGCRSPAVMKSRSATGRTIPLAPACSTHS